MNFKTENNGNTVEFITTPQLLSDCVQYLSTTTQLAIDLEFDRDRHAYGFNLCLIQASAGNRCFIIDPRQPLDCTPLFRLLENPVQQVLLHSHGEDLRLLHSLGCRPTNLLDTEIAAKLLGYEKTSLASMLEQHLKINLDKSQQKTNWLIRPLTPAQIIYASNDVIHLAQLKNILLAEAAEKNRSHWIEEENIFLSQVIFTETVKENFLSAADKKELSPYDQFLMNEWLKLRDGLAAKFNKPSYQVISPETIRDIISGKADLNNWPALPGIYRKLKEPHYIDFFIAKHTEIITTADAHTISKTIGHKPFVNPEEWERRKTSNAEKEKAKAEIFLPLKQRLTEIYGAGIASFILSNASIDEFIRGDKKISELKVNYRKELLQTTAAELKLDINRWL